MVDLSSASRTSAIFPHGPGNLGPQQFDRVSYPVKYYLVNYTKASYILKRPMTSSSTPGSPTRELESCPFKKDIQDTATMIDGLLSDVSLEMFFLFFLFSFSFSKKSSLKMFQPGRPNFFEVQTSDQGNDVWSFRCRRFSPIVRGTLSCARSVNVWNRCPASQH